MNLPTSAPLPASKFNKYRGQYVAMCAGKVVDFDALEETLRERVLRLYSADQVEIYKIGEWLTWK